MGGSALPSIRPSSSARPAGAGSGGACAIRAGDIGRVLGIDHRELLFREVSGWRAAARHHALSVMGVHWFDGFRQLLADDADWLVART